MAHSALHFFYFIAQYSSDFLKSYTANKTPDSKYIASLLREKGLLKLAYSDSDPSDPVIIPGIGSVSYLYSSQDYNLSKIFKNSEIKYASIIYSYDL